MKNKDLGAALTRNEDDMQLESFNLSEDEKMVRLQKYQLYNRLGGLIMILIKLLIMRYSMLKVIMI